jgi:alpha-D-ribose 1-methylphosphonate 5-phosphate C-P lyase
MLTKEKLENYYNLIIKNFEDEDEIVYFLNKPELLRKFDDKDREWLVMKWLHEQGWVEVIEDAHQSPEVMELGWETPDAA